MFVYSCLPFQAIRVSVNQIISGKNLNFVYVNNDWKTYERWPSVEQIKVFLLSYWWDKPVWLRIPCCWILWWYVYQMSGLWIEARLYWWKHRALTNQLKATNLDDATWKTSYLAMFVVVWHRRTIEQPAKQISFSVSYTWPTVTTSLS